jgi:hypothetical protein
MSFAPPQPGERNEGSNSAITNITAKKARLGIPYWGG